jgi:hypothetical protein
VNLTEFSRRGGKARQASLTPQQRTLAASRAASAYWSRMTPRERSLEIQRRRASRKETTCQ